MGGWHGACVYCGGKLAEVSLHPGGREDSMFVICCDIVRAVDGARSCDEVRRRLGEGGLVRWQHWSDAQEDELQARRRMVDRAYTVDVDARVVYVGARRSEPDPRCPRVSSAAQYLLLHESGLCGDDPWLVGSVIAFDALAEVRDVIAAQAKKGRRREREFFESLGVEPYAVEEDWDEEE